MAENGPNQTAGQPKRCTYCNLGLPDDRYLKCDGAKGCKSFVHWKCSLKTAIDIAEYVYTGSKFKWKNCSIKHIRVMKQFTESQCKEKTQEILHYLGLETLPAHTSNTISPRTNEEPLNTTVYNSCSEDSSDDSDDSQSTDGVQDLSEDRLNEGTSTTIATPNTPVGSVENVSPSLETIETSGNGTPTPPINDAGSQERT